ncbi:hypothetical protein BH09PLA1_BH09PLA1_15570 [soil metagenome]
MTNNNANIRLIEPAHAPEALSEAVIGALTRRMNPRLTFGPIKTLLFGLLSGGLIPLLVLPKLFRDFIIGEQTHLWHFAEWLRLQFPGAETDRLQQAISKLKFRWWPFVLSLILAALAIAWAWSDVSKLADEQITWSFVFNFTARLPHIVREFASVPRVLIAAEGFTLLLIAAHVLALWQIVTHVADIRRVVEFYNVVAKRHGLSALKAPKFSVQVSLLWIVCLLSGAILGAWWVVPMMLAAAAQWRYINRTGRTMRLALAAQVFNVIASRTPRADLLLPSALSGTCSREGCTERLPAGAGFCPRCGGRVAAKFDGAAA